MPRTPAGIPRVPPSVSAGYAHEIEWRPMRHLVEDLESVWRKARLEVRRYLAASESSAPDQSTD